jgi:hypothetical protein
MPEAFRALSHSSEQKYARRRSAPLELGTPLPEPPPPPVDEFDNPEFNALVDEAAAKTPTRREMHKRKTGPTGEDIARLGKELKESVRAYEHMEDPEFNALMDASFPKTQAPKREKPDLLRKMQEDVAEIDRKYSNTHQLKEHKLPERAEEEEKVILNIRKELQPKDEIASLQAKLQKMNAEEGKLHEDLNALLAKRGLGTRIGRWLSRLTGGVAETEDEAKIRVLKNDLEVLNSEQQDLMEEIETLMHQANARKGKIPRSIPLTPKRVLEQDQLQREEREENRAAAQRLETPTLGMQEEGAEVVYGLATPEEARKRVTARKKKEAAKEETPDLSIDVDLSDLEEPKLTRKKAFEQKAKAFREKRAEDPMTAMTIDRAAEILGGKAQAAAMWDKVMDAMKKKPGMDDDILLAVGESRRAGGKEHPATLYVFTLAEAERALQAGDSEGYKNAMKNVDRWNSLLGLTTEDVIGKKPQQMDRLQGVRRRRDSVNRTNTRYKF